MLTAFSLMISPALMLADISPRRFDAATFSPIAMMPPADYYSRFLLMPFFR